PRRPRHGTRTKVAAHLQAHLPPPHAERLRAPRLPHDGGRAVLPPRSQPEPQHRTQRLLLRLGQDVGPRLRAAAAKDHAARHELRAYAVLSGRREVPTGTTESSPALAPLGFVRERNSESRRDD